MAPDDPVMDNNDCESIWVRFVCALFFVLLPRCLSAHLQITDAYVAGVLEQDKEKRSAKDAEWRDTLAHASQFRKELIREFMRAALSAPTCPRCHAYVMLCVLVVYFCVLCDCLLRARGCMCVCISVH